MPGTNMELTTFTRCKFKNFKRYNDYTHAFQGFSGYVHPVNINSVSCDFDNCLFFVSQKNFNYRLSFEECTLTNGYLIHNMRVEAITFLKSRLVDVDPYATQSGDYIFNNDDVWGSGVSDRCHGNTIRT